MEKNYIEEAVGGLAKISEIRGRLANIETQASEINSSYERQIKDFKEARDRKLKPIESSSRKLKEDERKAVNQTYNILMLVKDYSFFDEDICPYIVRLLSLVEGREYTYKIQDGSCSIGYYSKPFLERETYNEVLNFIVPFHLYWKQDLSTLVLKPQIQFGKYSYIKDYLDAFISYKIANEIRTPVNQQFERIALTVMKQFIADNLPLIEARHNLRVTEKQAEMKEIYEMLAQGNIGEGRK